MREKTYEERMEEIRLRNEWLKRQPPLKSPCLNGRRRHCFGRGVGKIHKHCVYCRKSREQIRAEQRGIEG